jgi:hypothetical protein
MRKKKTLERAEPKPHKSRSQTALKALDHEGRHGALETAGTRQAHEDASQREPTSASRTAEKNLQSKGKTRVRRAA